MATKTEAARIYLQCYSLFVSNCTQIRENQIIAAVPATECSGRFGQIETRPTAISGVKTLPISGVRRPAPDCAVDLLQHSEPLTVCQFQISPSLLLGSPVTCRMSPPHKQTCTRAHVHSTAQQLRLTAALLAATDTSLRALFRS
jgi:hypothetical protein